jgi:hypothetical protein
VHHPPVRTDLACRNCGAAAPLKFCPECGQETTLHAPTLGEFLHEFVGHYVAVEGALWRTLRLLVLRPGRLTREYLAGRRRQYVLPLRLYLTASFLFFLAIKLVPADPPQVVQVRHGTVAVSQAPEAVAPLKTLRPMDCGLPGKPPCTRIETLLNEAAARFSAHPQEFREHLWARMLAIAPYAIFLLLPVFAGIMMLAYRNRRRTYGEHVVFSLHLHALWFLGLAIVEVLPESVGGVVELALPVYGTWAMHEAYGGRWTPTILRALFVSVLYEVALAVVSLALVAFLVVHA